MSAVGEPSYRKRVGYQAGLLGGFSTMAAILLISGHQVTREDILARQQEDLKASLSQVIPPGTHDNDLLSGTLSIPLEDDGKRVVYRAMRQNQVTGVAYQVKGLGYAGTIDIIMGVDAEGELLGARVLSHAETPGLGDKIEPAKDDWILDFTGLSLVNPDESRWKVKKDGGDFDQFSGATITPRAVVGAIKDGLVFFRDHQDALRAPPVVFESE
jgi:electron transport complex protein RnfG